MIVRVLIFLITAFGCSTMVMAQTATADCMWCNRQGQGSVCADTLRWKEVFSDTGTGDWRDKWILDGIHAMVTNTPEGMVLRAGPEDRNNAHHAVLWTRQEFRGDIKIEYDYTRLDSSRADAVNIIYIQARGSGMDGYPEDIHLWGDKRAEPLMKHYFDNMDTYHISYATDGVPPSQESTRYVRARRYMPREGRGLQGTALEPDYVGLDLFETGVRYHITVTKIGGQLWFRAEGENGKSGEFWFDGSPLRPVEEGYIGLRQMFTRSALYSGFTVSVRK
ncbi:MAG: DUF1961 family protein [Alistipes sp.]|nr:DUF1961 family protein [Alistipes sp.]